jgi:acyl carrier protein
MHREEIEQILLGTIEIVQRASGAPSAPIAPSLRPIGGLPGFDSLRGLVVCTELEKAFKFKSDENLFVSEDGKRALTVNEIVDRIIETIEENE